MRIQSSSCMTNNHGLRRTSFSKHIDDLLTFVNRAIVEHNYRSRAWVRRHQRKLAFRISSIALMDSTHRWKTNQGVAQEFMELGLSDWTFNDVQRDIPFHCQCGKNTVSVEKHFRNEFCQRPRMIFTHLVPFTKGASTTASHPRIPHPYDLVHVRSSFALLSNHINCSTP